MMLRRRSLLLGLLAAPVIVRASSLMSIVPAPQDPWAAFMGGLPDRRLLPAPRIRTLDEMITETWREASTLNADIGGLLPKTDLRAIRGRVCPDDRPHKSLAEWRRTEPEFIKWENDRLVIIPKVIIA